MPHVPVSAAEDVRSRGFEAGAARIQTITVLSVFGGSSCLGTLATIIITLAFFRICIPESRDLNISWRFLLMLVFAYFCIFGSACLGFSRCVLLLQEG